MNEAPFFSVVLAAYNRSRFIAPTIESVLAQTERSFELIVVGDGCDDDTGDVVRRFNSERITWRNLADHHGSQSAPNNEGQRDARGEWIAYVGHDDIWAPDHLAAMRAVIARDPATAFVASGCIFHGPPGSGVYFVTGLLDDSHGADRHFCPPSALAHRRGVAAHIGGWRDPRSIALPVDSDFQLRAVAAGLRFASTGRVTVHKIAAGHRYLSYLRPEGHEQAAMVRQFDAGYDEALREWTARSKAAGLFMTMGHPSVAEKRHGQVFDQSRTAKGIHRPPLQPLIGRVVLPQSAEPRALDWHPFEDTRSRHRWSGPNPRPKILIPFSGSRTSVAIEVTGLARGAWVGDLEVYAEGEPVHYTIGQAASGSLELRLEVQLCADRHTVLGLHTPTMGLSSETCDEADWRRIGVAVGDITLSPVPG